MKSIDDFNAKTRLKKLDEIQGATIHAGRVISADGEDISDKVVLRFPAPAHARKYAETQSEWDHYVATQGGFFFAFFQAHKAGTIREQFGGHLTQADLARLLYVATYAGYNTGRLQTDNGRPMTRAVLQDTVGISRSKFTQFYNKLKSLDIVEEIEDGTITMNPRVFFYGNIDARRTQTVTDVRYTRVFRDSIRRLYDRYGTTRACTQLGVVYSILPYVNLYSNVVCHNPKERNFDLLQPICLADLAEILGYKQTRELTNIIDRLKISDSGSRHEQALFLYYGTGETQRGDYGVIINPRVVYAGDYPMLKAAQALFKLAAGLRRRKGTKKKTEEANCNGRS